MTCYLGESETDGTAKAFLLVGYRDCIGSDKEKYRQSHTVYRKVC